MVAIFVEFGIRGSFTYPNETNLEWLGAGTLEHGRRVELTLFYRAWLQEGCDVEVRPEGWRIEGDCAPFAADS